MSISGQYFRFAVNSPLPSSLCASFLSSPSNARERGVHRGCRSCGSVQARALTARARGAARHAARCSRDAARCSRKPWSARYARRPPPFGLPATPLARCSPDADSGGHFSTCCHDGHRHWRGGTVRLHQDMLPLHEESIITDAAAQNWPRRLCTLCGCAFSSSGGCPATW